MNLNLKKFFKKQILPKQTMLSDEDITLLAFMCSFCAPDVTKHGICSKHYAYYATTSIYDLDIAKYLFERNGIKMQVHHSHIRSSKGQDVLRMRYKNKNDYVNKDFFSEILNEYEYLLTDTGRKEEEKFAQKLEQLRANYKTR